MNIKWKINTTPILYEEAITTMEHYVDGVISNSQPNMVWLLEHFDVYTKGTSATNADLLNPNKIPVVESKRGGKITYHGKGQQIIYPIINLVSTKNIKLYVNTLETWIINTLTHYDLDAFKKDNLVGIWVLDQGQEKKIAAIGIRVRKWVAYHGIAVNISPNLQHFQNIIPCGLHNLGVTSLQQLKKDISFNNFNSILKKNIPPLISGGNLE